MDEEIPKETTDIPENMDNPEKKDIPEAVDDYDELAQGAEIEETPKRGRGRPKGAKNRQRPPPLPLSEESEEEPPPPPPRQRKPRKPIAPSDVEFDVGYGGAGPQVPIRMKRAPAAARSLLDVVAEAAQQHGAQERDRRRSFYERFLPI